MELIELPMLPYTMSLDTAWGELKTRQRSAVIRADRQGLGLVAASEIVHGIAHQYPDLAAVQGVPVHEIVVQDLARWGLDKADPYQTEQQYDDFLDHSSLAFALLDSSPKTALVVVRHAPDAFALGMSPSACYCQGRFRHRFPPPKKRNGDICSRCGAGISCV